MTPRVPPAPPTPFSVKANRYSIAKGTTLFRTHSSSFRAAQFNPCLGQQTRFAPIRSAGVCVSSLYAATTEDAAAFESIFHDIEPSAQFKTVRQDTVMARDVSRIMAVRDLVLVPLFAPDLAAWGLVRTDLIETPKSTYAQTAEWAAALHDAYPSFDGLAWTSRQCDPDVCVLLFGDRVDEAEFNVVDRIPASDSEMLARLRAYGLRAGITIVC